VTAAEPFSVERKARAARKPPRHARRKFTRAAMVKAIRAWAARYGTPPTADDWDPARARALGQPERAARFTAGEWPSARMVRREFGTFGAALAEAGFTGHAPTTKPHLSGRAEILRAIREWTRRYGEPPAQSDWDVARARTAGDHWRVMRFHAGDWPSLTTTRAHFGSLSAAIRSAGLEPPTRWEPLDERVQRQLHNALQLIEQTTGAQPGPATLATSLSAIAQARHDRDDAALHHALTSLATAATTWAHAIRWQPDARARG
jgi:hypothetical protein